MTIVKKPLGLNFARVEALRSWSIGANWWFCWWCDVAIESADVWGFLADVGDRDLQCRWWEVSYPVEKRLLIMKFGMFGNCLISYITFNIYLLRYSY